ncbi:N-acetylmuramoyl-L-alanine amidase [Candidatus Sumerlaeota bacterium]|nr:N-acetylmuramoyl-L-alanine amidase [Candidatus Sumerlaeota bacterium]
MVSVLAAGAIALCCWSGASAQQKICVDPGHGGSDPGGVGSGQQEKVNVLNTSLKFRTWLNTDTSDTGGGGSWSVLITRTTDVFVSLSGRCDYANNNGANRFMSIHNNAFNNSAHGIETFAYTSGGSTSFDLRNKVYEEALAMWPLTPRGTKTANFYVLKYTNMAAELHEAGFIDSSIDSVYVGNSTHQNNHAKSELWALQRHYGLAKYTPSTAVVVTVDNDTSGWSASANWTLSTSSTEHYGANYRVRPTASTSDAATWTANLPSSGNYKVEAWWSDGSNRSTSAPYIVDASGGSVTVNKDQQANGGSWQNLGTFAFGAGNNTVRLSCWTTAGYYVIGDAVRFTKQ